MTRDGAGIGYLLRHSVTWVRMEAALIVAAFGVKHQGHCAEVGAYDGRSGSVGWLLEQGGWNVLAIEPNPGMDIQRSQVSRVACSNYDGEGQFWFHEASGGSRSALVPEMHPKWKISGGYKPHPVQVRKLDTLLDEWKFKTLDVLLVDVEGGELQVLQGANLTRWQPRLIIAENWDEDSDVTKYLEASGYAHIATVGVNDVYMR